MLVVDSSAILAAQFQPGLEGDLSERLATDGDLSAPHLVDLEFLQGLRRMARRGRLSDDRVHDARAQFADLAITRYPHAALANRIWELRPNLSAYDAAYVALAEILGVPLVTCDAAIANAPGTHAEVELFEQA